LSSGCSLSPCPVFGKISGGHSAFFQFEDKTAFTFLVKDVRVPETTKEHVIWFSVPSAPTVSSYDLTLWRDAVIDEFSFSFIGNLGEAFARANSDENVVNRGWGFPIVVDGCEVSLGVLLTSTPETSRYIGSLSLYSTTDKPAGSPPQRSGEKGKEDSCDSSKGDMILFHDVPRAFGEEARSGYRNYERGRT
jgi:hypothetical protein